MRGKEKTQQNLRENTTESQISLGSIQTSESHGCC